MKQNRTIRTGRPAAPRRARWPTPLLAAMLALLPVLAGCEDRTTPAGLPAAPRDSPPPVLEDTPRNPAAAGGQRAGAGQDLPAPT